MAYAQNITGNMTNLYQAMRYPPSTAQVLAAGTQIAPNGNCLPISAASAITLTGTPTIIAGFDGQQITLINVGTFAITLQDAGTLTNSALRLNNSVVTLPQYASMVLTYNATLSSWCEVTSGLRAQDPLSGIPKIVRKVTIETVNNTAVLQDDNELFFALAANEVWQYRFFLRILSNTTPDFQAAITVPAGATGDYTWVGFSTALAITGAAGNLAMGSTASGGNNASEIPMIIEGIVLNGATPGNLQLQWAQNTNNVSDTSVLPNSTLFMWRLA